MSAALPPRPRDARGTGTLHEDAGPGDTKVLHHRWATERDRRARDVLVARYQGLVHQLASRYRSGPEDREDLRQVANVGLINALERFEPERGLPFRSFAVPTILGELRRHCRDTRWAVHTPRGLQERFMIVEQASEVLTGRLGRAPTVSDLAEQTGLSEEQVVEAHVVRQAYDALSLDRPQATADGDDDITLIDTLGAEEDRYEQVVHLTTLAPVIRALPVRERRILHLRFAEDLTQSEIAQRLGISQMQVSRVLRRSLERLRTVADVTERADPVPRAA